MLHSIPESALRAELLKVVALQERLVKAMCALPKNATVDLAWLKSVWTELTNEWLTTFWNNEKGRRALWLGTVAAASESKKASMLDLWQQHSQFDKLYSDGGAFRIEPCDRKCRVMDAFGNLLTDFYAPLLYSHAGFPVMAGDNKMNKDKFIHGFAPRVKVCPYTDYPIPSRATKLDHFLPKEKFPALSCHPDNLFPCSTDANNGGRKGTTVPLELDDTDQAEAWFHPRLRSAKDTFTLEVGHTASREPKLSFVARNAPDQPRLQKLDDMFHLTETWAGHLDDAIGELGNTVSGMLKFANKDADFQNVRDAIVILANQRNEERKTGRRALAIAEAFFYLHVANSRYLLNEILDQCAAIV